jgi:hypothetical protein
MPRRSPRIEPKSEYEYIVTSKLEYDEIRKKPFIRFIIETVQHFVAFTYELVVRTEFNPEDRIINFQIEGLNAPDLGLPATGPARYEFKLYDFKTGDYRINVIKQGKGKNQFLLNISKDKILLKRSTRKNQFVKLNID